MTNEKTQRLKELGWSDDLIRAFAEQQPDVIDGPGESHDPTLETTDSGNLSPDLSHSRVDSGVHLILNI